jgi:cell division protein ZapD
MNNAIRYAVGISQCIDSSHMITYEYPLNDTARICLRLESLFSRTLDNLESPSEIASRNILSSLLEILNVIDRPDLKSKLTQTLTQYNTALTGLQQNPNIEQQTLFEVTREINIAMQMLRQMHGRIGDNLRKNQFLNTIKMQLNNPGGACDYSTPAFALWLTQDVFSRKQQVLKWFTEFQELKTISELTLRLIRESATWEICQSESGFYQQKLDFQSSHQMLRVRIPVDFQAIPEFSVGKHRFSMRMLNPNFKTDGQPTQCSDNVDFEVMVCKI